MLATDFKCTSETVKYSDDDLVSILSNFNRTLENVGEDIALIKEWLKLQKHILIETSDREILYFLVTCKFSFEKTKEKLNMYYCIRGMLPEYYKNRKPSSKEIQYVFHIINSLPLPQLSPELNRVIVFSITVNNSDKYKGEVVNSCMALLMDTQAVMDFCNGNEYIIDLGNFSLDYALKYSIMDIKKLLTVSEKVYSARIAKIHIVNAPGYCDALISVVKAFLKEKLKNRICTHKSYETLYDYYPKSMLPSDFGGEGKSMAEIKASFNTSLLEFDEHFEKLNGIAVNESLRPESLQNDEILGFHGSFRKLQVD